MTTEKTMAAILDMMTAQNQAISALLTRIEKLEKSSATLEKQPTETKVQKPATRTGARKPAQASAPTREEKPAKQPKKQAASEKKPDNGLKVVKKFGTQEYLRVPRGSGNVEVCHVNRKTKRGNCVATIHAKAEPQDMGLIKAFIVSYERELTYTAKLAKAGIKDAASLRKATDAQLMQAFGC